MKTLPRNFPIEFCFGGYSFSDIEAKPLTRENIRDYVLDSPDTIQDLVGLETTIPFNVTCNVMRFYNRDHSLRYKLVLTLNQSMITKIDLTSVINA